MGEYDFSCAHRRRVFVFFHHHHHWTRRILNSVPLRTAERTRFIQFFRPLKRLNYSQKSISSLVHAQLNDWRGKAQTHTHTHNPTAAAKPTQKFPHFEGSEAAECRSGQLFIILQPTEKVQFLSSTWCYIRFVRYGVHLPNLSAHKAEDGIKVPTEFW